MKKGEKIGCWWCSIRSNGHALSNDCHFERKNQTVKINQINEVFGGPLAMCIYLGHQVNDFDNEDLFG